jgi:hypothetical protein
MIIWLVRRIRNLCNWILGENELSYSDYLMSLSTDDLIAHIHRDEIEYLESYGFDCSEL